MGPRVFSPREATGLIPELENIFRALDQVRDRLRRTKGKMDVLEMIWGDEINSDTNPDRREHQHYLDEIERAKQEFEVVSRRFAELEVHVKSIETGLVDFYGVAEGRLVFLCWKRGEEAVEWYHPVDEGFTSRRPIRAEDLAR